MEETASGEQPQVNIQIEKVLKITMRENTSTVLVAWWNSQAKQMLDQSELTEYGREIVTDFFTALENV